MFGVQESSSLPSAYLSELLSQPLGSGTPSVQVKLSCVSPSFLYGVAMTVGATFSLQSLLVLSYLIAKRATALSISTLFTAFTSKEYALVLESENGFPSEPLRTELRLPSVSVQLTRTAMPSRIW